MTERMLVFIGIIIFSVAFWVILFRLAAAVL